MAVYPNQVKSVTGNRGTFDPDNPDIRYARGEPWAEIIETANGPAFMGNDVILMPTGVEGAGTWGDGSIFSVVDTQTGERLAKLIVGLDGNKIHTLYGLYSDAPKSGAGTRTVAALVENADAPL